jgi:hypothetical protein
VVRLTVPVLVATWVENGLREALDAALAPPVVLTEQGGRADIGAATPTPPEVAAALSGENDVWLASCKDFYGSPYALKKGSGCPTAIWGCMECPNAVFTTRHLPSIYSYSAFLDNQRDEMPIAEWKARYGLAWERITTGILPKFTREQRARASSMDARSETGTADPATASRVRRPMGSPRLHAECPAPL